MGSAVVPLVMPLLSSYRLSAGQFIVQCLPVAVTYCWRIVYTLSNFCCLCACLCVRVSCACFCVLCCIGIFRWIKLIIIVTIPLSVTVWPQFAMQILTAGSDPQSGGGPRPLSNKMLLRTHGHSRVHGDGVPHGQTDHAVATGRIAISMPPNNGHNSRDISKKLISNTRF